MSKLLIVAENRSHAPAAFIIDVFDREPIDQGLLTYDQRDDPGFLFRFEHPEPTEPGRAIRADIEVEYEAEVNEHGPVLWFRCPAELSKRFFLHEVTWNGQSMLVAKGAI